MSYLELLKLAAPEAVVVVTALIVLAIGLTTERASAFCSVVAALGLMVAIGAVLMLPQNATLFGGMLVITPLTSLFKIICLALALFTVFLARNDRTSRNPGEYLAMLLLATIGLMLLVGSEELLMIFIGLELTGLSLYVMAAFDKTDVRSAEAGLKYSLFGRPMLIRAHPSRVRRLSPPARRSLRSSCLEKSCSSVSVRCTAMQTGTQWSPAGCRCWQHWRRSRSSLAISSHWRSPTCAGYSPTPPSPTPVIHCSDSSPAGETDFPRRCSTPPFTRSHSSARLASSRWCTAKQAATISLTFRDCRHVPRCSPGAWRSSCYRWLACRRSLDFSESSTSSAPPCAPVQTTACFGSSRWRSLAV